MKTFFFLGGVHPKICDEDLIFLSIRGILRTFYEDHFFGLHPRVREISRIFCDEDLFFMVFTLAFEKKSFCAPSRIVYAHLPPSQSRYFGARPAKTKDAIHNHFKQWTLLTFYYIRSQLKNINTTKSQSNHYCTDNFSLSR